MTPRRRTRASEARAADARRRQSSRAGLPVTALSEGFSEAATARMSLYLRALLRCEADGISLVASEQIAQATDTHPALVRKDLAHFGQFGIRGVGYEVATLRTRVTKILGLDQDRRVVILGAGNLGLALADYRGFNTGGFKTIALFDVATPKIGTRSRGGVPVRPMKELAAFAAREKVDVAVLAVPAEEAQKALDAAVGAGVRAILNFVPLRLRVRRGIYIRSVDLKVHLESLAYLLTRGARPPRAKPGPKPKSKRGA